jgi:hypothetical protein
MEMTQMTEMTEPYKTAAKWQAKKTDEVIPRNTSLHVERLHLGQEENEMSIH